MKKIENIELILSDLSIYDWCNQERVSNLTEEIKLCFSTLQKSCLLAPFIKSWIRCELLIDIVGLETFQDLGLNSDETQEIILKWADHNWGHRIESIYLSQKHLLDRVTCSMLRVHDQHLALEIFHRIKANEYSFEYLSWHFGEGEEKKTGGRIVNRRFEKIPKPLHSLLRKLGAGDVLKPHRVGDWYVILQLHEFHPAQFDDELKALLLNREVDAWVDEVQTQLHAHLELELA